MSFSRHFSAASALGDSRFWAREATLLARGSWASWSQALQLLLAHRACSLAWRAPVTVLSPRCSSLHSCWYHG
eukprot:4379006-Amphidinium_carterae.1